MCWIVNERGNWGCRWGWKQVQCLLEVLANSIAWDAKFDTRGVGLVTSLDTGLYLDY